MAENPYVDEWGHHLGYCNNPDCGEEQELGQECQFCEVGEIVAFEDDPDPDDLDKEPPVTTDGLEALLEEELAYEYCHHIAPVDPSVPSGCRDCHAMAQALAAVVRAAGWRRTKPRRVWVIEVDYDDTLMTFTTEDEDSADHAMDLFAGNGADVTIVGEEA